MKDILLLDINETIDNPHSNSRSEFWNNKEELILNWVMPLREDIRVFSDFLEKYRESLMVVFFSSVWIRGQQLVARELSLNWNKKDFFLYDWEKIIKFKNRVDYDKISTWIWMPKSRYVKKVIEEFKWNYRKVIWFEDSLCSEDKLFVVENDWINHVKANFKESMSEEVKMIEDLMVS